MLHPLVMSSWDNKELEAIQNVIQSGQYSMGPKVAEYERLFADFFGSKYSVMCSSGSTANLLMVAALFFKKKNPLKRGDTVIVPAVSWSTTYYPLAQYGLKLKFVDVDKDTLNFNLQALDAALKDGSQIRLIMAVNLLGNPNDFTRIQKMIDGKDILLIEDNCESMGASFEGQQCGTFGIMGTFSSFFSHHISTMEGGNIVTDDEELYHIILCLRAHGWTRNLPKKNHVTGLKSEDPFEESFKFVLPGYNVRPLEFSGAIGIEQLKKLPNFIKVRRKNAEHFRSIFDNNPSFLIQKEIGKSSWFGFSFILNPQNKIGRKEVSKKLLEAGIDCRPIVAGNFAKNPVVKFFDHEIFGDLKNAQLIDQHGLFIGNHHVEVTKGLNSVKTTIDSLGL